MPKIYILIIELYGDKYLLFFTDEEKMNQMEEKINSTPGWTVYSTYKPKLDPSPTQESCKALASFVNIYEEVCFREEEFYFQKA